MKRNKFFWIGFIIFMIMLILFFMLRFAYINGEIEERFSFDPIFYVLPVVFMLGGILTWKKKEVKDND